MRWGARMQLSRRDTLGRQSASRRFPTLRPRLADHANFGRRGSALKFGFFQIFQTKGAARSAHRSGIAASQSATSVRPACGFAACRRRADASSHSPWWRSRVAILGTRASGRHASSLTQQLPAALAKVAALDT